MAATEAASIGYWFRQKYNLAPTDPRYLAMTDEDLALEFEAHLAFEGEPLKTCPQCGVETHRPQCPTCKTPDGEAMSLTGDSVMDEAFTKIKQGENIDLEKIIRGGFVPVAPGEEKEEEA